MVEAVCVGRGLRRLRIAAPRLRDYLHPVVVWVEGEGNVLLSAVRELFLKPYAVSFEF
jgi:hypothetical protein